MRRDDEHKQLVPGYDLEEETARDVAPIGPTELSGRWSEPPASEQTGPSAPLTAEDLEKQIRELEGRLHKLIRDEQGARGAGPARPDPKPGTSTETPGAAPDPKDAEPTLVVEAPPKTDPPAKAEPPAPAPAPADAATAKELLSTDFYLRQWGRAGLRSRSEEVDEFGFDPKYEARYTPLFDFLYKHYFRVEVEGIGHIPDEGRCLVVSNHSGGPIPYDGIMLRTAVRQEHATRRDLRWLAEDFVYYLPFAGTIMNRLGAVRACQENAERLLGGGRLVAVFPEGVKGIGKLYKERYKLQRFGRGGFIRLCLRTGTPLVPCAIVGAEETNPLLYRVESFTRALGLPYLPITPTFPALGPLGLVPAPTKWKMRFGEIVRFDAYGPDAADDEILVGRLAERVRGTIQGLIDEALAARKSIWFG